MNYRQQYEEESRRSNQAAKAAMLSLIFAGAMLIVCTVSFLESENVFHGGQFSGWYASIMKSVSISYV